MMTLVGFDIKLFDEEKKNKIVLKMNFVVKIRALKMRTCIVVQLRVSEPKPDFKCKFIWM